MSSFSVFISSYHNTELIEVWQDWQIYSQVYTAMFYGQSVAFCYFYPSAFKTMQEILQCCMYQWFMIITIRTTKIVQQ